MPDARPTEDVRVQPPAARSGSGRRGFFFFCGLAGMAAPTGAWAAALFAITPPPEPFPDSVRLLVAGPRGGQMDRWADAIGAALFQALPPGIRLHQTLAGGADGVTAANQFEARVAPDGETVLLLPGKAPLAWLTGDPRARFDAAGWLPVMTGLTSGVLASRIPVGALRPGTRLRVAASEPAGPELAALLGLDLMGIEPVPALGLHGADAALKALQARQVDAVFIAGADVSAALAEAHGAGAVPLFTLGMPSAGCMRRDPLLPAIPTAPELATTLRGAPPAGPLAGAWRSAAAATQIEFALVLPALTPAALVSQWRRAGAVASRALQGQAPGVHLLGAPEANVATAAVAAGPAAMLALRHWLAARFNWQPS